MELHQLRYFLAVARFRSFTRAAEHEHVAQPSLSQQIRKLEDELGGRLFDRLGRKIAVTPLGARFLEHARRVLEEVEGARHEATEMLGLRRGSVGLGAIPTVAPYLLPRVLPAFRKAHPHINVTVRGSEFEAEALCREAMVLVVPRDHLLRRRAGRRVALSEVAHEPFLLLKEGHCFRDDVFEICKRSRLSPQVAFEGGQFETLVAMVAAGAGITLLPEMACLHFRRPGVRLVELRPPRPTRTIGFVRAKDKYLTPAARALIQVLKETCAK
jgi:LysR family hydrogen peroxide-inducible transcriptional activator